FLTSIADKTQNALKESSFSQHLPSSITGAPKPADSGSTQKNLTLGQIQHQFRQLQQNYSTTVPVQKIITAEKGVTLDLETLSRDAQAQSKELYTWGQHEQPDVKDVSDRLGFLNYIFGSLSGTLAGKLNTARAPLKELRDNEVALTQRRNVRAGLKNQIGHLEHSQEKGTEKRIAELKEQLAKAEKDDEPIEKEHMILMRKALKESEQQKFQALREYGEKLSLLSQAADAVLAVLPSVPPSPERPYASTEETGTIRASLQHSVDQWKPGQVTLLVPAGAILDRSHTGSFGETHVEELKQIKTEERPQEPASPPLRGSLEREQDSPAPVPTRDSGSTTIPSTTSAEDSPVPVPSQDLSSATNPSTTTSKDSPINLAAEPNQPAPILSTSSSVAVPVNSPGPVDTDSKVPSVTPTVTGTG
ncbi:Eisosome component PIL1-domain-containing protein, partial [Lactarius quietus]